MAKKSGTKSGNIHPAILILLLALSVFSVWAFINQVTKKPCATATPSGKSGPSDCDKMKTILSILATLPKASGMKKGMDALTQMSCTSKHLKQTTKHFVARVQNKHTKLKCDDLDTIYNNILEAKRLGKSLPVKLQTKIDSYIDGNCDLTTDAVPPPKGQKAVGDKS